MASMSELLHLSEIGQEVSEYAFQNGNTDLANEIDRYNDKIYDLTQGSQNLGDILENIKLLQGVATKARTVDPVLATKIEILTERMLGETYS